MLKNIGKSAGKAVIDIGKSAGKVVTDIGKSVGKVVTDIGKSAGQVVTDIGKSAGKVVTDIGKGIGQAGRRISTFERNVYRHRIRLSHPPRVRVSRPRVRVMVSRIRFRRKQNINLSWCIVISINHTRECGNKMYLH